MREPARTHLAIVAVLAAAALAAASAHAEPDPPRQKVDKHLVMTVYEFLQMAGLPPDQIHDAWRREGARGLLELAERQKVLAYSLPIEKTAVWRMAVEQAISLIHDPAFVGPLDGPPPSDDEVPPRPQAWRWLDAEIPPERLTPRAVTSGRSRLLLRHSTTGNAMLSFSVSLRTADGPARKGCMAGSGETGVFRLGDDGSFAATLPAKIGFHGVPASAPDPCATMTLDEIALEVEGRLDPETGTAAATLHWPTGPLELELVSDPERTLRALRQLAEERQAEAGQ